MSKSFSESLLGVDVEVRRCTPAIGAEILGVDLRLPFTDEQVNAIRELWLEHQVIFFRNQNLTLQQHVDFGRLFGKLHIHTNIAGHQLHREVLTIHADENSERVPGHNWS